MRSAATRHAWGATKPPVGTPLDRAHPLAAGLLAYWPLAEGGGATVYDLGPTASHGVFSATAPTWGPDLFGPALTFTLNSATQILAPTRAALTIAPPLSIALWARHAETNNKLLLEINGNTGWSVQVSSSSQGLGAGHYWINMGGVTEATNTSQSKSAWNDNKWHLLVYVVPATGSGATTLYVDGADDTNTSIHNAGTPSYAGASVSFGARTASANSFGGQIGGAWYWNRALRADEARQLAQNPLGLLAPARRLWVMPRTQGPTLAAATLAPSGTIRRTPAHAQTGSSTPGGALARTPSHGTAGSTTPAGALARLGTLARAGSSALAGALARTPAPQEAGASTLAGALGRTPAHTETGRSTPAGALARTPLVGLVASLSAGAGTLARTITGAQDAALAASGALGRAMSAPYAAGLAATGDLARTLSAALGTATLGATGALRRVPAVARAAALDLAGSFAGGALHRLYTLLVDAALDLAGALTKEPRRPEVGTLAPGGALARTASLVRAGAVPLRGRYVGLVRVVRRAALALVARAALLLAPYRARSTALLTRTRLLASADQARPATVRSPARARTLTLSPHRTVPMQLVADDPDAPLVIAPLERNIAFTADFSADIPSGRQIASVATQVVRLDDPTQTDLADDFVATSTRTNSNQSVEVIVGNGAQQERATYRVRIIATLDNSPATDLVGYFDLPCRE